MRQNIAFNFKFNLTNVTKISIKGEKTMRRILIILALTGFIAACDESSGSDEYYNECVEMGDGDSASCGIATAGHAINWFFTDVVPEGFR